MFTALMVNTINDVPVAELVELSDSDLMDGEVLIDVAYSGINYKDAMAVTGTGKIINRYPLIPGIDLVGTIRESDDPEYPVGTQVIVNGWGMGESHHGGFAQRARVPSSWLTRLPTNLDPKHAGVFGTAGYTAALSVLALAGTITPDAGKVIVTGANGGVGGVATLLLSREGYQVTVATSRPEHEDYLKALGASEVISLTELNASTKPLQHAVWIGGVDALGGQTLANMLAQTDVNGAVAACGLAESSSLPSTVLPFILRGVSLLGINSVYQPSERRNEAWALLSKHSEIAHQIDSQEIGLAGIVEASSEVIAGKARGRYLVNPNLG